MRGMNNSAVDTSTVACASDTVIYSAEVCYFADFYFYFTRT